MLDATLHAFNWSYQRFDSTWSKPELWTMLILLSSINRSKDMNTPIVHSVLKQKRSIFLSLTQLNCFPMGWYLKRRGQPSWRIFLFILWGMFSHVKSEHHPTINQGSSSWDLIWEWQEAADFLLVQMQMENYKERSNAFDKALSTVKTDFFPLTILTSLSISAPNKPRYNLMAYQNCQGKRDSKNPM